MFFLHRYLAPGTSLTYAQSDGETVQQQQQPIIESDGLFITNTNTSPIGSGGGSGSGLNSANQSRRGSRAYEYTALRQSPQRLFASSDDYSSTGLTVADTEPIYDSDGDKYAKELAESEKPKVRSPTEPQASAIASTTARRRESTVRFKDLPEDDDSNSTAYTQQPASIVDTYAQNSYDNYRDTSGASTLYGADQSQYAGSYADDQQQQQQQQYQPSAIDYNASYGQEQYNVSGYESYGGSDNQQQYDQQQYAGGQQYDPGQQYDSNQQYDPGQQYDQSQYGQTNVGDQSYGQQQYESQPNTAYASNQQQQYVGYDTQAIYADDQSVQQQSIPSQSQHSSMQSIQQQPQQQQYTSSPESIAGHTNVGPKYKGNIIGNNGSGGGGGIDNGQKSKLLSKQPAKKRI